ncbi:ATP synthase F1 subunit epsilon [Bacteroidetes/Chlorobi group bacterium ChocPot_Mid]|jgi:F-type H+-transporting ATPase subunit epsilon|nr:MAG: ATP synthase F1 subunit epsilon [Bacteroidetes/Chlorobi group bacterium ChocPot_Mid]
MEQEKILDVEIVTPQMVIYEGKAQSVSVPGSKSPFQILNNHAPIVSTLDVGLTKIVDESGKLLLFATGSGFTEVHRNKISILVESAFDSAELNSEEIRSELAKAKELFKAQKTAEYEMAVLEIENKLKVAEKARN